MKKPQPPFRTTLPPRAEEPAGLVWGHFSDAKGADIRYAFSPPPAGTPLKGHIVLLPGFKECIEKYFEAMRDLHARGYAVWAMDWRGQGGSQRYIADEPHKAHHEGYDEQLQGLQQFMQNHVIPAVPQGLPLHLMAHSMGGHIALRWLHDHNQPQNGKPGPVASALLTAPMLDINTGAIPRPLARQMARFAKFAGTLSKYVPGGRGYLPPHMDDGTEQGPTTLDLNPETSNLTSDAERIKVLAVWFARKPELALADPTYGWVYQTMQSVDILNQEKYLKDIATPILMEISGQEKVVLKSAAERAADLMPNCTRVDIKEARHEIWMERDALRNQWLKAMDDFLARKPGVAPAAKKPPKPRAPARPR